MGHQLSWKSVSLARIRYRVRVPDAPLSETNHLKNQCQQVLKAINVQNIYVRNDKCTYKVVDKLCKRVPRLKNRIRMSDNITGARVHRITPIQRSGWGKKKDKIISFRSIGQFDRSRGFESRNSELNQIETSQVQSLDQVGEGSEVGFSRGNEIAIMSVKSSAFGN